MSLLDKFKGNFVDNDDDEELDEEEGMEEEGMPASPSIHPLLYRRDLRLYAAA